MNILIRLTKSLFILSMLCFSINAYASNQLDASVDRNKIGINETLNLRVVANIKMDFSFGGLMNFGRNQVESPDLTELEKDFEILDQQQNYSMRSVNGETSSQVVWNYALSPKKSGALVIPALKLKDAESSPIKVQVSENDTPRSDKNPPAAFIEFTTDKASAYVQEQVLITVRLFTKGRLSNGSLTEPESTQMIIEPFGEDKKFYRMVYNQRYEVVERQYLAFPQESGTIELDALTFNGMLIDSQSRRRLRIRELSKPLSIQIKPPADIFTGDYWLPALTMHIEESWQNDSEDIQLGDSITRTVKLSALGLLGSALPPLEATDSTVFKVYPDKPELESLQHDNGAQSSRTESITYVAIKPGKLELPEIVVKWWDTVNDVERIAKLPAKTITVMGSASSHSSGITKEQSELSTNTADHALPQDSTQQDLNGTASHVTSTQTSHSNNTGLISLLVLVIVLWAISTWYLIRKIRYQNLLINKLTMDHKVNDKTFDDIERQILKALDEENSSLPLLVISWFKQHSNFKSLNIESLNDLRKVAPDVYEQLHNFEAKLYSKMNDKAFDKDKLKNVLNDLLKDNKRSNNNRSNNKHGDFSLKPFYPS